MRDILTPELRALERAIDAHHRHNALLRLPFARAVLQFMAFYEDLAVMRVVKGTSGSLAEAASFADYIVNKLQYPMSWFRQGCPAGGEPRLELDEALYQAAIDLDQLAFNYEPFVSAFTYASRGIVQLELVGTTLRLKQPLYVDPRYDAYDRLAFLDPPSPDPSRASIIQLVQDALRVGKDTFSYQLGRRLVQASSAFLKPVITGLYELPADWTFPKYSLGDFRAATTFLLTLAHIHFVAHVLAARGGCDALGFKSALIVIPHDRLIWLLVRHANISATAAQALVRDLTYGERGITHPDPALQPIVKLNDHMSALMPTLFISSSMERNLICLLNRLPEERAVYLRLVDQKEALMRSQILSDLRIPHMQAFHGPIPGRPDLPDIDLALVSPVERSALILELKWFIAPAEPREVIEKANEILVGIRQLLKIAEALRTSPGSVYQAIGVDPSYTIRFCLLSENSIGDERSQHPYVPVLNRRHFVSRANEMASIQQIMHWLEKRDYLPVDGEDFRDLRPAYTIGDWTLEWYALEPLRAGAYTR